MCRGALTVSAMQSVEGGTLQRMIRAVEHALASRARVERRVDRVTAVFIPAVLLVAVGDLCRLADLGRGGFFSGVAACHRGSGDRMSLRTGDRDAPGDILSGGGGIEARHPDQQRGCMGDSGQHRNGGL